jgi:hypothetical protein
LTLLSAASTAYADNASITLTADANFVNLLLNGTTGFNATVGNLPGAGASLDWAVDNNGVSGLTLSGASSAPLAPGGSALVAGSYTGTSYGTVSVSARATGTNSGTAVAADNSPAISNAVQINVGVATAALSGERDLNAFNAANTLSAIVTPGGSYTGLSSKVIAASGVLGTEAILLGGSNTTSSDRVVSMNWRNRSTIETSPTTETPPITPDGYGLASDVVSVTGLSGTSYVLQMNFKRSEFQLDFDRDYAWYAERQFVYVAWLDPSDTMWKNAVMGNSAGSNDTEAGFQGVGVYSGDTTLGHWGVDLDHDLVWAVLDHTSQFAASPEPATMSLLVLGAVAILVRRRARRAAQ